MTLQASSLYTIGVPSLTTPLPRRSLPKIRAMGKKIITNTISLMSLSTHFAFPSFPLYFYFHSNFNGMSDALSLSLIRFMFWVCIIFMYCIEFYWMMDL